MRAYRKNTVHPVCLYLTLEEARELAADLEYADSELQILGSAGLESVSVLVAEALRKVGKPVAELPL